MNFAEQFIQHENTKTPFQYLNGIEIIRLQPGESELHLTVQPGQNDPSGCLSRTFCYAIAETSGSTAVMVRGKRVVTIQSTIHYHKPILAKPGDLIKAIAKEVRQSGQTSVVESNVYAPDGTLAATALVLLYVIDQPFTLQ